MNDSVPSILFRTRLGRTFLLLWTAGILLATARIAFEVQTLRRGATILCRGKVYDYALHVPPGSRGADHRYPLLIYLHGAGERQRTLRQLARADLVHYAGPVARSEDFPFLVVCPKTSGPRWEPERVIGLLDELLRDENLRWKIDPTRVYLTGYSMGGFGTFSVAAEHPDRFTAIAPVAGGGDPGLTVDFARLPVWAFHGELDEVVPCEHSTDMIEALRLQHSDFEERYKLTIFQDMGHGIAHDVYRQKELYRWFLQFRNETPPPRRPLNETKKRI